MERLARRTVGFASGFAILATLSGCSIPDQGAARLEDGQVVFVFCTEFVAETITVETRALDNGSNWGDVWEVTGSMKVGPNFSTTLGLVPETAALALPLMPFEVGDKELVFVAKGRPNLEGSYEEFEWVSIDGSKLNETRWLTQSDELRDEPCEDRDLRNL